MSNTIEGFHEGYSLTYQPLALVPPPSYRFRQATDDMYGPAMSSFRPHTTHPVEDNAAPFPSAPFPSAFNDPRAPRHAVAPRLDSVPRLAARCKNVLSASITGVAQCIDAQGMCHPPINNRCPAQSVTLNQMTGTVRRQP